MGSKLGRMMIGVVLGGGLLAGMVGGTSCGSSDNSGGNTGGSSGGGAAGASANMSVYNMQLSGGQQVPENPSTATATVMVMLDRTTGAVTVTGSFIGLSSNASAAHVHGPAASGSKAAVLIPLTVPPTTSGTVSGSGTMTGAEMSDMTGGMTYVDIHSAIYPDGEIRAQIRP